MKDSSGSMFVYILIITIFLLTFTGLVGEIYRVHSIQTHIEFEIQRAVNIAVEEAMHDSWRQDKISRLDVIKATQNLIDYFDGWLELTPAMEKYSDGTLIYYITLDPITVTEDPPRLHVSGKIFIPSAFPIFIENIEIPFSIASRNSRLD